MQDPASLAQCQDTTQPSVPYPTLRRIDVLGWQRGAVNATLQVGTSVVNFSPDQVRSLGAAPGAGLIPSMLALCLMSWASAHVC